jgi:hypothetical protein
MSWYMAILVRGAHVAGVLDDERLGDMLYILIHAADPEEAYAHAVEIGKEASDTYEDEDGTSVELSVLGLADLTEIGAEEIGHGTEVYSQLIPKKPLDMIVAKEELTVFETGEDEGDEDEDSDATG